MNGADCWCSCRLRTNPNRMNAHMFRTMKVGKMAGATVTQAKQPANIFSSTAHCVGACRIATWPREKLH